MKFVDTACVKIKAGNGGRGMAHFQREKFVPAGAPDGGDGGRGGSIFIEATTRLSTLLDFCYVKHYKAFDGLHGGTNNKTGKTSEDLILSVPCGTVAYNISDGTKKFIGEVLSDGEQLLIARGGRGGVGNTHFTTSTNQAPIRTIPPELGESLEVCFELKMIADVGIIGSPNAGKSSLISVISNARPKVADYPFTTLVPNLGVVNHKNAESFVIADVPGLISGASAGKGLGLDFLRHIERSRILIHLIDGSRSSSEEMIEDFSMILKELEIYNSDLLKLPIITAISKIDVAQQEFLEKFEEHLFSKNINFLKISSVSRVGLDDLLDKVLETFSKM